MEHLHQLTGSERFAYRRYVYNGPIQFFPEHQIVTYPAPDRCFLIIHVGDVMIYATEELLQCSTVRIQHIQFPIPDYAAFQVLQERVIVLPEVAKDGFDTYKYLFDIIKDLLHLMDTCIHEITVIF